MTDVVLSEPVDTQSLMSITRDVSKGGGAVIPASHPARVRKVRPSQLKGKRASDLVENRSMTQKPIQHKDYLSEQRAKRLGKQKVRGKEDVKKSKTKQEEKDKEKEEEEGEKERVEVMNEANAVDSRLISAGSNSSKDEGISSNGEKEEDFETEEGKIASATTDDAQHVPGEPNDDDDEGRGSIKDEGEELPDQFNNEVPAEEESGKILVDEVPPHDENEPTSAGDAVPPVDPEKPETVPQVDIEPVLVLHKGGELELVEDANGYSGDMDEPNSLAASHQLIVGLSGKTHDAVEDSTATDTVGDEEVKSKEKLESLVVEKEELTLEEKEELTSEEKEELKSEEKEELTSEEKEEFTSEEKEELTSEEKEELTSEEKEELTSEEKDELTSEEKEELTSEEKEEPTSEEKEEPTSEEKEELTSGEKEEPTSEEKEELTSEEKEELTSGEKEEPTSEEKEELTSEKVESKESDPPENTEIVVDVEDNDGTVTEEQVEALQEKSEEEAKNDERKEENEDEIKEIPALAKISGRHKPKNLNVISRKHEPDAARTPRKKNYDVNKVTANRKPISWRPGPIQATSNKSETSRLTQKKFKARRPMENSVKQEGEGEAVNDEAEQGREGGGGDLNVEAAGMELVVPLNLDTFRSEGHVDSLAEEEPPILEKSESLPELPRPSTAGRKNKICRRRKVRSRINSTWKKNELPENYTSKWSITQTGTDASTSEVWVPEENRLYIYTYSSEPRLLHVRRLGSRRGVVTTDLGDHDPNSSFRLRNRGNGNPMYDRRVVRGSNYAKRLGNEDTPKWNPYFTNARSLENIKPESESNQRRQEFREKLEARARMRRESHGLSSLYPSHATYARPRAHSHAYVQTENYYEPLERPPEADVGMQTEAWGEDGFPPPVVFQSPAVVDMATQVFEDELFVEEEGEVAVAALVARTLREATLEVLEEEQAEEERLTRKREALLSKVGSVGEDQQENSIDNEREDEVEGEEDDEDEERKDPDGKETSPLDTQEPARSPELPEDLVKGATLINDDGTAKAALTEAVQESESVTV